MTSATPKFKTSVNNLMIERTNGIGEENPLKTSSISAIVDQVVEQLDNTTLNERPTTSWRRRLKTPANGTNGTSEQSDQNEYDEDMLLDANLDDILPD